MINYNVLDKLEMWGQCVRTQRVSQRIRAKDLCARIDISDATLRRMEKGDPSVSAAAYLSALNVLGVLDMAAPMLQPVLYRGNAGGRARPAPRDDDDF